MRVKKKIRGEEPKTEKGRMRDGSENKHIIQTHTHTQPT